MTQVNIGKGLVIDVAFDELPEASLAHVLYIGARNILMDAHAGITEKTNPNAVEMTKAALAMAEKKLAALMVGDVRVRVFGTRKDRVTARAIEIALRHVTIIKGADGKRDAKAMRAAAAKLVETKAGYRIMAAKQVADEDAMDLGADEIDMGEAPEADEDAA